MIYYIFIFILFLPGLLHAQCPSCASVSATAEQKCIEAGWGTALRCYFHPIGGCEQTCGCYNVIWGGWYWSAGCNAIADPPPGDDPDPDDPHCDFSAPGSWMVMSDGECKINIDVINGSQTIISSSETQTFLGSGYTFNAHNSDTCKFIRWTVSEADCCTYSFFDPDVASVTVSQAQKGTTCWVEALTGKVYSSFKVAVIGKGRVVSSPEAVDKIDCPDKDCESKDKSVVLTPYGCKSVDCTLDSWKFSEWQYTSSESCSYVESGGMLQVNMVGTDADCSVKAVFIEQKGVSCEDCKATLNFSNSMTAQSAKILHPGGTCPPVCKYTYNPSSSGDIVVSISVDSDDPCSSFHDHIISQGSDCCEIDWQGGLFDLNNSNWIVSCKCGGSVSMMTAVSDFGSKVSSGFNKSCSDLDILANNVIDDQCDSDDDCNYLSTVVDSCTYLKQILKNGCVIWDGECCIPVSSDGYSTDNCSHKECFPDGFCEKPEECPVKLCKEAECINDKCEYKDVPDCDACTGNKQCDDGEECTFDECQPNGDCKSTYGTGLPGCDGPCTPGTSDCEDGDPGTVDKCTDSGICKHEPKSGTTDCEDDSDCKDYPCKYKKCVCSSPCKCVYTKQEGCCQSPSDCNDGDDCTEDGCTGGKCVNTDIPDCKTEKDSECDPCEKLDKILARLGKLDKLDQLDKLDKLDQLDKLSDIKDIIQAVKDMVGEKFDLTNEHLTDIKEALDILKKFDPDMTFDNLIAGDFSGFRLVDENDTFSDALPFSYRKDSLDTGPVPIWGVTEFLDKVLTDNYIINKISGSSVELTNPVCSIPIFFDDDSYLKPVTPELSMCDAEAGIETFGDILVMIVTFSSFVMIFLGGRD